MIDKIFEMYFMLLGHKKLTAKRIADELDISQRTVYRYLDEFPSFIPVCAEKGVGGGISILEDYKLYATTLSKDEKNFLISAIDMLESSGNVETAQHLKSKILSLDHSNTDIFSLENTKIVVDNSYIQKNDRYRAKVSAIDKALNKRIVLDIKYHDRHGNVSERSIEPITFVIKDGTWYIYAWCRMRNEARLFKLSRISHIKFTDETFVRRKVDRGWTLIFNNDAVFVDLYLEVQDEAKYDVEEWLGINSIIQKKGKNIAIATIRDDTTLYEKLLSFGSKVKVLSPTSVREKLIEKIKDLSKLY